MTTDQTSGNKPAVRPTVGPVLALFLSILVLPGLGQMLTGRLGRGLAMAGAMALCLLWAIIRVGMDLNKIMPQLMEQAAAGNPVSIFDVQNAMSTMMGSSSLPIIMLPMVVIWFWTLADSVRYLLWTRRKTQ